MRKRPLGFLATWLTGCPGLAEEHYEMSKSKIADGQPWSQEDRVNSRQAFELLEPAVYLAFADAGRWITIIQAVAASPLVAAAPGSLVVTFPHPVSMWLDGTELVDEYAAPSPVAGRHWRLRE